jgi:hypothetical protein
MHVDRSIHNAVTLIAIFTQLAIDIAGFAIQHQI